jgi:hypothetical protein
VGAVAATSFRGDELSRRRAVAATSCRGDAVAATLSRRLRRDDAAEAMLSRRMD